MRAAERAPAVRPPTTSGVRVRRLSAAATHAASRMAGAVATPLPATRQGCSSSTTVTPVAGQVPRERHEVAGVDAAAGAVAEQQGGDGPARPVPTSRASPCVATRRSVIRLRRIASTLMRPGTSSSGSGSSSSGPLLRTLLTALETG